MKFFTLLIMVTGMIVLFNAAGIETPTGGLTAQFLDGGLSTFKESTFWTTLVTILTVGIAGTAIAGLFGRAPPESFLIASLSIAIGGVFLTDLLSIYSLLWRTGETWIRWVASSVFIPLTIGFFASLISWWRGTES